jgi:hypothetical protein
LQGLNTKKTVSEGGIHILKLLTCGNGGITAEAKEASQINGESGFAHPVGAGDGPSPIRGIAAKPFCDADQNLACIGRNDIVTVALLAGVIFLKIDRT